MKRAIILMSVLFLTIIGNAQNYFESIIEPTGLFREAEHVVETSDHGFIVSCGAFYVYQNDILVLISPVGEVAKTLNFQIDGKNLKYCGLYNNPAKEGEYIAVAVLSSGTSSSNYVQHEIVFLGLDDGLDVTSQNICDLGVDFLHLVNEATSDNKKADMPMLVLEDDGTFVMAAHCEKTDGYCYLFARMTSDGVIVAMNEDHTLNGMTYYIDDFFVMDSGDGYGMLATTPTDTYYWIDSTLNCMEVSNLVHKSLKVVQEDPQQQYPDTTFYYFIGGGKGAPCCGNALYVTCTGQFLKHYGGRYGWFDFVARLDDDAEVEDLKAWNVRYEPSNYLDFMVADIKALDVTRNAVYHCGIHGIGTRPDYYRSSKPTKMVVSKFDRDMNLLWRRYIGADDAKYDINVIRATDDGGCIMTGVCSFATNNNYYYSYILKLDAEGYDSVSELDEGMSKPYYCYPNPANESLNIEFSPDVNCRSVGIYSLDGRLVETFPETSPEMSPTTTIDISDLTPGIYILKVKTTDGKEYTERIVKE